MFKKILIGILLVSLTGCSTFSTTIVLESRSPRGDRPTVRVEFRPVIER